MSIMGSVQRRGHVSDLEVEISMISENKYRGWAQLKKGGI